MLTARGPRCGTFLYALSARASNARAISLSSVILQHQARPLRIARCGSMMSKLGFGSHCRQVSTGCVRGLSTRRNHRLTVVANSGMFAMRFLEFANQLADGFPEADSL